MRKEIIFHPAKHPRWPAALEPIRGYTTAYGLVLHRALSPFRESLGYWDVSDIQTGAQVAVGEYPGIEGAVAALVRCARSFNGYRGGIRAALAEGRHQAQVADRLVLSLFPNGEPVLVVIRDVAELIAGLNATAIKLRDANEFLVLEAAEVVRHRIHERTGISVPIV